MLRQKLVRLLKNVGAKDADFEVIPSPKPDFGHYSTNLPLRLANAHRRSPMAVAEKIAEKIRKSASLNFIQNVQVAPPGFINFWLTPGAFQKEFQEIVRQGDGFGGSDLGRSKTVILEYSSPNVAKPMHVGHLRNTVLGDALANIHGILGYTVVRWNYLGDWGTQFGKLVAAYKRWGKKSEVEKEPMETLSRLYVRFHEEAEKHPELEEMGRYEFRKLEDGDKENRRLWGWLRKVSLKEFSRAYKLLGVKFNVSIGESFFEKDLEPIVLELVRKKIATESQGALIIPLDEKNLPPVLIQKSDGTSLYITREIANLKCRLKKYKPGKILYVVGNEQSLHFEQFFAVAEILGLGRGVQLTHVKYGLVLDEGGKKFSTREGRTVSAEEVLQKAVRLSRETVEKKNPGLSAKEKARVAQAVGTGAVKYLNLKENRNSTVVFDWKKMLDFRGDSAPYLQYTHARLKSILRKAGRMSGIKYQASRLAEEQELLLIRKMSEFPNVIQAAGKTLAPNALAVYLYELANEANSFYESTPILRDKDRERRNARLALVAAASGILKRGLGLLGISAPEKI